MLNFEKTEETKLEQEEQLMVVTATAYARSAQYRTLLITLRSAVDGEGYDLEKVARHVVKAFDELEGAGC